MTAPTTMSLLFGAVWVMICATALLVFRRPVVRLLFKLTFSDQPEDGRRRDLSIGVVLVAAFAYTLGATGIAMSLIPPPNNLWPLAFGLPVGAVLAILYWVRFQNAGLSLFSWGRR